jgi:hypothetical protein
MRAWLADHSWALYRRRGYLGMHDAIHVAEGVIGDLRSVPVVLAGAFLGPREPP